MGIRFRKSIKLGKHARINIGKKGIGYSFGVKGARLSFGADGNVRKTLSIPGTGIYHTETISGNSSASSSSCDQPVTTHQKNAFLYVCLFFVGLVFLVLFVSLKISFRSAPLPPPPASAPLSDTLQQTPPLTLSSYLTSFLEPGETQLLCIEFDPNTINANDIVLNIDNADVAKAEFQDASVSTITYVVTALSDGCVNFWASTSDQSFCTENVQFVVESPASHQSTYPQSSTTYVLNTSTNVIHKTSCGMVNSILPENKMYISDLYSAISDGCSACKHCSP